MVEAN